MYYEYPVYKYVWYVRILLLDTSHQTYKYDVSGQNFSSRTRLKFFLEIFFLVLRERFAVLVIFNVNFQHGYFSYFSTSIEPLIILLSRR